MRPSGRNAIRQGRSKLATVVMLKGMLASGFCSPMFTWAQAATDASVVSNAAFANLMVFSSSIVYYHPSRDKLVGHAAGGQKLPGGRGDCPGDCRRGRAGPSAHEPALRFSSR